MVYDYKENRLHARCRRLNNSFWDISVDIGTFLAICLNLAVTVTVTVVMSVDLNFTTGIVSYLDRLGD